MWEFVLFVSTVCIFCRIKCAYLHLVAILFTYLLFWTSSSSCFSISSWANLCINSFITIYQCFSFCLSLILIVFLSQNDVDIRCVSSLYVVVIIIINVIMCECKYSMHLFTWILLGYLMNYVIEITKKKLF